MKFFALSKKSWIAAVAAAAVFVPSMAPVASADTPAPTKSRIARARQFLAENGERPSVVPETKDKRIAITVTLKSQGGSPEARASLQNSLISTWQSKYGLTVKRRFTSLLNGFSATIPADKFAQFAKEDAVLEVHRTNLYYPAGASSRDLMQLKSAIAHGSNYRGTGMVVAIIDTGIDTQHQDMKLDGETGPTSENCPATAAIKQVNPDTSGTKFTCKVPNGYNYADDNYQVKDLGSSQHGMHVAGIVAANGDTPEQKADDILTRVDGIAPDAQLLAMKVQSNDPSAHGMSDDALIAAVEDSVKMGADVINMSLGSTGGFTNVKDGLYMAIKAAADSGVLPVIAAGNEGRVFSSPSGDTQVIPNSLDDATLGSPAASSSALTVGAINAAVKIWNKLTIEGSDDSFGYDLQSGKAPDKMINIRPVADPDAPAPEGDGATKPILGCQESDYSGRWADTVALVMRGACTFKQKFENAKKAGVAGIVIFNKPGDNTSISMAGTEGFDFPIGAMGHDLGEKIAKLLWAKADHTGRANLSSEKVSTPRDDAGTPTDFSSWGPTPDLTFKPEISGIGGGVYSTLNDNKYGLMNGTSMATPNVAGAAALVLQSYKDRFNTFTKSQRLHFAKLALTNTAKAPLTSDHVPYSLRRSGSGLAQIENAENTTVVASVEDAPVVSLRQITEAKSFTVKLHNFGDKEVSFTIPTSKVINEFDKEVSGAYAIGTKYVDDETLKASAQQVTVPAGSDAEVTFTVTPNASRAPHYIQGFAEFKSADSKQPSLHVPYLGFVGNWGTFTPNLLAPGTPVDENIYSLSPYYNSLNKSDQQKPEKLNTGLYTVTISPNPLPENGWIEPNGMEDGHYNSVFPQLSILRGIDQARLSIANKDGQVLRVLGLPTQIRRVDLTHYENGPQQFSTARWDGRIYDPVSGEMVMAPTGEYKYRIETRVNDQADWQVLDIPFHLAADRTQITAGTPTKGVLTFNEEDDSNDTTPPAFTVGGEVEDEDTQYEMHRIRFTVDFKGAPVKPGTGPTFKPFGEKNSSSAADGDSGAVANSTSRTVSAHAKAFFSHFPVLKKAKVKAKVRQVAAIPFAPGVGEDLQSLLKPGVLASDDPGATTGENLSVEIETEDDGAVGSNGGCYEDFTYCFYPVAGSDGKQFDVYLTDELFNNAQGGTFTITNAAEVDAEKKVYFRQGDFSILNEKAFNRETNGRVNRIGVNSKFFKGDKEKKEGKFLVVGLADSSVKAIKATIDTDPVQQVDGKLDESNNAFLIEVPAVPGQHTVTVTSYDAEGGELTSHSFPLNFDAHEPQITLEYQKDDKGNIVPSGDGNTVHISGDITDAEAQGAVMAQVEGAGNTRLVLDPNGHFDQDIYIGGSPNPSLYIEYTDGIYQQVKTINISGRDLGATPTTPSPSGDTLSGLSGDNAKVDYDKDGDYYEITVPADAKGFTCHGKPCGKDEEPTEFTLRGTVVPSNTTDMVLRASSMRVGENGKYSYESFPAKITNGEYEVTIPVRNSYFPVMRLVRNVNGQEKATTVYMYVTGQTPKIEFKNPWKVVDGSIYTQSPDLDLSGAVSDAGNSYMLLINGSMVKQFEALFGGGPELNKQDFEYKLHANNGEHLLIQAGNQGSTIAGSFPIVVDNKAPEITYSGVENGQTLTENTKILIKATDPAVRTLKVIIDGEEHYATPVEREVLDLGKALTLIPDDEEKSDAPENAADSNGAQPGEGAGSSPASPSTGSDDGNSAAPAADRAGAPEGSPSEAAPVDKTVLVYELDTTGLAKGEHDVKIESDDYAGNVSSSAFKFSLERPMAITGPQAATVKVPGSAWSNPEKMTEIILSQYQLTGDSEGAKLTVVPVPVEPGTYQVEIVATLGEQIVRYPVTVTLEKESPVVLPGIIGRPVIFPHDGDSHVAPVTAKPTTNLKISGQVERLAGPDRAGTALQTWKLSKSSVAVLVSETGLADALAAGVQAAHDGTSILFTKKDKVDAHLLQELKDKGITEVKLFGGNGVISPAVVKQFQAAGIKVSRTAGADRYETAVQAAKALVGSSKVPVVVARGDDYADALTASSVAHKLGGVVMLTKNDKLPAVTAKFIAEQASEVIAIGGPSAKALANANVKVNESLIGKDRFATALKVANKYFADAKIYGVANGFRPADALVSVGYLSQFSAPLLLVGKQVPGEAAMILSKAQRVILFGGTGVLPQNLITSAN